MAMKDGDFLRPMKTGNVRPISANKKLDIRAAPTLNSATEIQISKGVALLEKRQLLNKITQLKQQMKKILRAN